MDPADTTGTSGPASDRMALFSGCIIFQALPDEARRELADLSYVKTFNAGDLIFAAGTPGLSMMVIAQGEVRISFTTTSARDIILTDFKRGEVFGEIALIDGDERSADARALTNCTLLVLERRHVNHVLTRYPEGAMKLLELLCRRLRHSNERLAELAYLDVSTRLAKALLRIIGEPAGESRAKPAKLSISQGELANMIGCSRENVNRCLKNWQRKAIVDLKSGWLIVPDVAVLQRISDPV